VHSKLEQLVVIFQVCTVSQSLNTTTALTGDTLIRNKTCRN